MLRLQLLGGFRAFTDAGDVAALEKQPRRAALLTYLALQQEVHRERVIALLWPESDAERGRHSLNQGIYYLRQRLGPDWVELRGDRCVVAPWVLTDVHQLERAAVAAEDEEVLRLYLGPLLAGTHWAVTAEFDMWVDQRRAAVDRFHRAARRRRLAALRDSGRHEEALRCAEAWCRLDPLEDEAQHGYMTLLAAAGQRAEALRQFASYRRLLSEHDLQPLDETLALVEQLQQGDMGGRQEPPTRSRTHSGMPPAAPPAVPPAVPAGAAAGAAERPAAEPDWIAHTAAALRESDEVPIPAAAAAGHRAPGSRLLNTRPGLGALLGAVFALNWLETTAESWLAPRLPGMGALGLELARAAHWLEGHLTFENHDMANRLAVIGYSASYFIIFPLLLVVTGLALAARESIRPFRLFSLAVVINYLISLPFFLFFPVPERWTWPDAEAIVLSDLWSTRLLDMFRPISGIDNSFPSFHVSLTVLVVLTCFLCRARFRWSALFLGATVVLATFALGIHWIPDLLAGAAAGVISVALAVRADRHFADRDSGPPARAVMPTVTARETPPVAAAAGGAYST